MQIELLAKDDDAYQYLMDLSLDDGIERTSAPIEGEEHRINLVSFSLPGNSIRAARMLAKFRDGINYEGLVLILDDPSKRFEVNLYSLIADFERGLRGILSIYRTLNNAESNSVLDNPEQQDFGAIFSALFIDESFVARAKKTINSRAKYAKNVLVKKPLDESEHTYWDELFPKDSMPTIRQRHDEIRSLRNDVMHSHRMSYKQYMHDRTLLKKAIAEMSDYMNRDIASDAMGGTERLSLRITQDQAKALADVIATTFGQIKFDYDWPVFAKAIARYDGLIRDTSETVLESWTSTYGPLLASLGTFDKLYDVIYQARISEDYRDTLNTETNREFSMTKDDSDDTD